MAVDVENGHTLHLAARQPAASQVSSGTNIGEPGLITSTAADFVGPAVHPIRDGVVYSSIYPVLQYLFSHD